MTTFDRRTVNLKALNSLTKYPSIPTYHQLDPRNGGLTDEVTAFGGQVIGTEKVDGCLTSDTKVSLADGTRKKISQIVVGDEVLGMDDAGRVVATPVLTTFNNGPATEWMKVKGRRRSSGRGSSFFAVNCTPNHRFWLSAEGEYRAADELRVGDRLTMIRSELELAPCQSSVLLGKLLGDGHLARSSSGSAAVVWGHRAADKEYVDWTLRALGDIASPALRMLTSGYESEMLTGRSAFHPAIAERFGSMVTPAGKAIPEWVADALDPIALAFWYMDDGSLSVWEGQENRASIATNGFSEDDCKVLLAGLSRLGIDGTLMCDGRGYLTIRLGVAAAEQLFLLVAPYVPPVMQRKLPERYRGHDGWLPPTGSSFRELLVEQTIDEIARNVKNRTSNRYDIETGTHNFFANGVLVHNSNARIVLLPPDDGGYLLGSREELLYANGDLIGNPALGIVEHLRDVADSFGASVYPGADELRVFYVELYGGKIGGQAKQYTTRGATGWRLFDVVTVDNLAEKLTWAPERISAWRDQGGQSFADETTLWEDSEYTGFVLTPRLFELDASDLPSDIDGMDQFLHAYAHTQVALDDSGKGGSEGIVLRTPDRSVIAKARFQDYERTLKRRANGR